MRSSGGGLKINRSLNNLNRKSTKKCDGNPPEKRKRIDSECFDLSDCSLGCFIFREFLIFESRIEIGLRFDVKKLNPK